MRKVILSMVVTLDNFVEEANGAMDWQLVNEKTEQYAAELISMVDAVLYFYGRIITQSAECNWSSGTMNPMVSHSGIVATCMQLCLVDDNGVIVDTVVAGNEKDALSNTHNRLNLQLLKTKTFHSGVVILYHQSRRRTHLPPLRQPLPFEN